MLSTTYWQVFFSYFYIFYQCLWQLIIVILLRTFTAHVYNTCQKLVLLLTRLTLAWFSFFSAVYKLILVFNGMNYWFPWYNVVSYRIIIILKWYLYRLVWSPILFFYHKFVTAAFGAPCHLVRHGNVRTYSYNANVRLMLSLRLNINYLHCVYWKKKKKFCLLKQNVGLHTSV